MDEEEKMKIEEKEKNTKESKEKLCDELSNFLRKHSVYETIPENMKILVFNTELSIKDSIEAMLKEDIFCALLWDTELNKFIRIFTIRDFLNLFKVIYEKTTNLMEGSFKFSSIKQLASHLFQRNPIDLNELDVIMEIHENSSKKNSDSKSIESDNSGQMNLDEEFPNNFCTQMNTFKDFFKIFEYININDYISDILPDNCLNFNLISISLDGNLYESIDIMRNNKIHRIIIEDAKNANLTGFITYETIFEFFITNYYNCDMTNFQFDVQKTNIINKKLIYVGKDTSIYESLIKFHLHKISMLPVVDEVTNKIYGFFYLKDLIYFFANSEKFKFKDTISKFLDDLYEGVSEELPLGKDRLFYCKNLDFNIKELFENMSLSPERKIFAIDDNNEFRGIITLSDLFKILINDTN